MPIHVKGSIEGLDLPVEILTIVVLFCANYLYYTYVSKVTLRIWGLRMYRSILTEIAQNCSEPIFMLLGCLI